ncbi:T9SS type A sorting domain-containing protein [Polaribacter uvawellassae]|uniref:T9SS type A sorting domain-containing protein n=1 Tax=Polaribacter uvawellassae TaxID=3133495 RepID=UPI00321ACB44
MKKIFIFLSILFISFLSFGQNPFTLTKSVSFGLNHHTNRDYPNFSFIDKEKNSILIGTTERDSTFNDVLVTKLDENYNLVWQKTSSFSTSLSYELPLKAFVNSNDDIYVLGATKTNSTKIYGILFYIKYDKDGNELFKKTIGNIDGSDYHDFGYFDVELNSDDTLNLVYSPHKYSGYGSNIFHFLEIDTNGNATELFTREIKNQGVSGKIENDTFYFLSRNYKNLENTNEGYSYTFLKIDKGGNENLLSIENTDFHNYYLNNNYENFHINVDNNKNLYITTLNQSDNDTKGKINISLIDKDNLLKFVLTTGSNKKYYLIDAFINSSNKLVVVANDLDNDKLVFLSVDDTNQIITLKEIDSYLGTGFKLNIDGTFFITTSNSNIRLFSNDLKEFNSFNTSDSYNLVDFSKIDDNTITSLGVEVNKMFPESDVDSELNIISEKINSTDILNKYSFSGEGTSANFQQIISVDNNNDYIVLSAEWLGPKCLFIGCAQPPLSGKIIKYNSELKVLWELDLTGQVNNITSNYYGDNIKIDVNNNIYLNLENKERDNSYLYKISADGKLIYKKESIKSKEIIINETNNKVYIISNNISFTDQTTWKTSIWSELKKFNLTNGDLINSFKYDHKQYFNHFIKNEDLYIYFQNISTADYYSKDRLISLYKEGELIFEKKIGLKDDLNINPHKPIIKNNGTIIFSSDASNNIYQRKLHKITINNEYSNSIIQEELWKLVSFKNKIFATDKNQYLNVYDENFNLIKKSNKSFNNCCSGFNYSIVNNEIFIQWSNDDGNNSAFLNENLEIINEFNFTNLFEKNFTFDKEKNLITTNTYGNGIYLKPWVSWTRGLLSKYSFNPTLSIDDISINNNNTVIKVYPNPTNNIFTIDLINNSIKKIELYSINGQLLNTYFKNKINLENFISGLYLLKVFTEKGTIINSKILKQ